MKSAAGRYPTPPCEQAMAKQSSIFAGIPSHLPEELFTTICSAGDFRVERIVSLGHASPAGFWYDQETDEWVLLLQGAARLRLEGDELAVELKPGDYVHIKAHQRHRVEWTTPHEPTVWLAVHYADIQSHGVRSD